MATDAASRRPPPGDQVVVFDLDGTLVDSAIGIAAALNNLAAKPVDVEFVRCLVSKGATQLISETLEVSESDVPEALKRFREIYMMDPCRPEHLFPGVEQLLQRLLQWELRLAVCTNKPQALAEGVIDRLGLSRYFSTIVGSEPGRPDKPDPAPLREVVTRMNAGQTIFVGDSMMDALTAEAAGAPFIHAAYGYERVVGVPVTGVASDCMGVAAIIEKLLCPSMGADDGGD